MAYPYPQYYPYQQNPQYYNPQFQQMQQPQPQVQQNQSNNGIIWVNSEQEAMAYIVMPNSAVTLWNSAEPVVYLKQADASGKPSMRTYDLVERTQSVSKTISQSGKEYARAEDLKALAARVDEITQKLEKPKKEAKA